MLYQACPHCGASLYIVVKWDKVICPFCGCEIIYPSIVPIDEEKLWYWRQLYKSANMDKNKEMF